MATVVLITIQTNVEDGSTAEEIERAVLHITAPIKGTTLRSWSVVEREWVGMTDDGRTIHRETYGGPQGPIVDWTITAPAKGSADH